MKRDVSLGRAAARDENEVGPIGITMRTLSTLLLLPPLLLGSARDAQDPASQDAIPPVTDVYGRSIKTKEPEGLAQDIQGCWQLIDIDDAIFPPEGRLLVGYLLIGEGFLATETHIAWDTAHGDMIDDDFQSGIHEYRLDPKGVLITSSLIGAFLEEYEDHDLDLEWEDPGTVRSFTVRLSGNFLTLSRSDGSSLSFSRRPVRRSGAKDIFGREVPQPTDEGK